MLIVGFFTTCVSVCRRCGLFLGGQSTSRPPPISRCTSDETGAHFKMRAMLGSIVLFTAAATGFYVPAPIRGSPPRIASPIRALEKPAGLPQVRNGLFISQVGTVAAWSACAQFAMCTYKPHRLVHNYIGTTQALTAIPLIWACFSVLISATKQGVRK